MKFDNILLSDDFVCHLRALYVSGALVEGDLKQAEMFRTVPHTALKSVLADIAEGVLECEIQLVLPKIATTTQS